MKYKINPKKHETVYFFSVLPKTLSTLKHVLILDFEFK